MAAEILVTGDVVLDVDIYSGVRMTPDSSERGTDVRRTPGGAMLTAALLKALAGRVPDPRNHSIALTAEHVAVGIDNPTVDALAAWPMGFHSAALWEVREATQEIEVKGKPAELKEKRWFPTKLKLGYGAAETVPYPGKPAAVLKTITPRILVLDDGMLGFRKRTAEACWPSFLKEGPDSAPDVQWIVLKMSSPLAAGDLWHLLADKWKDRLILIVSAADVRRADVRLARGLSWDQTIEDFLAELDKNGPLADLCACRHLVVTLASEGAIGFSRPGDPVRRRGKLLFDRKRAEGEFDEERGFPAPYGSLSIMAASVTWRLWYERQGTPTDLDLTPAIKAGLSASRVLRELGHGLADRGSPAPGFPMTEVVHELCTPIVTPKLKDGKPTEEIQALVPARHSYASVDLPDCVPLQDPKSQDPDVGSTPWTILRANTEGGLVSRLWQNKPLPPLFGAARRLALFGPASLSGVPYARFGKVLTMDRGDIESLRAVRQLMLRYKADEKPKTPLSIAVFGAPGSGKSFGLKQIAEAVFQDKVLEFNLSQFKGPEELYGAYHQVRDKVLSGVTPVVFWDEFDSRELMWLQYVLAPMQDVFQEGQLTHSIGKCVFVFAGGTSYDYRHFGPVDEEEGGELDEHQKKRHRDFVLKKGPDFRSRLTASLNVLGPNPRSLFKAERAAKGRDPWKDDDPADIEFPIRRAILLRGLLGRGGKNDDGKQLSIDPGLLSAILEVGHYRNGARSFEKLVTQIVGDGAGTPSRANLPHREMLEMLVREVDDFYQRLGSVAFGGDVEELARRIHARYLRQIEGKPVPNPESAKPWEELSPDLKASSRAAAQRVTVILAAVGLECAPGEPSTEEAKAARQVLDQHIEVLAEMEHDGWMDEKRSQGWMFGEKRDNDNLKHPLMVPYGDLPELEKVKDRDSIREYPARLAEAGYKIVFRRSPAR